MKSVRVAIALAAVGLLLCLWLLAGVTWYNFMAFMLLAQPLLLLALVIFIAAVVRELRRRDAAMARTERSGGAP
jgi:high-affinity Fe2+/Pb2+ permease